MSLCCFSRTGGKHFRLCLGVCSAGWSWRKTDVGALPAWWGGGAWCRRRAACWAALWVNRHPAACTPTGKIPRCERERSHLREEMGMLGKSGKTWVLMELRWPTESLTSVTYHLVAALVSKVEASCWARCQTDCKPHLWKCFLSAPAGTDAVHREDKLDQKTLNKPNWKPAWCLCTCWIPRQR